MKLQSCLVLPAFLFLLPAGPDAVAETTFEEVTVTTNLPKACPLHFADMDGDGDLDIVASGTSDSFIAWYEQTDGESFPAHYIMFGFSARQFAVADLDGDGDQDVVAASFNQNWFRWYENQGPDTFLEHVLSDNLTNAHTVDIADLDQDGDLDLLLSTFGAGFSWWENDGAQQFSEHILLEGTVTGSYILAIDWDDDGDLDMLGVSEEGNSVYLWTHEGDGSYTLSTLIDTNEPHWLAPADLDGDGDIDFGMASYGSSEISWWANDGSDQFTQTSLAFFSGAVEIEAADFDADGDLDLVGSALGGNQIEWWENDGAEAPEFTRHALITSYSRAFGLETGDFDGDGDIDIAGTGRDAATIKLWYNQLADSDAGELRTGHMPDEFELHPAAPNPFNNRTTIRVSLPERAMLHLAVFDSQGRHVRSLHSGEQQAGNLITSLDATGLATGSYFLTATLDGGARQVQRVVLVK